MTIDDDEDSNGRRSRPPAWHPSWPRQKVSLSTSDRVVLGTFFAAQTIVLFGVGVQMWTRLAVVETDVKHVSATVIEIKQQVSTDVKAVK